MPTYDPTHPPLRYLRRQSQLSCSPCSSQESEDFPQLITLIQSELSYTSDEDDASAAGTPLPDSPIATDVSRNPGNFRMMWAPLPTSIDDHDFLLAAVVRRRHAFSGDRPLSSLDLPSPNDAPSSPSAFVDPFAFTPPNTILHDEAAYDGMLAASRDDDAGEAQKIPPILRNLSVRGAACLSSPLSPSLRSPSHDEGYHTSHALAAGLNFSPSTHPEDVPIGSSGTSLERAFRPRGAHGTCMSPPALQSS